MLTTRPYTGPPAALLASRQCTAAARDVAACPLRWTRMTSSQSDSERLKIILSRRIPALLTRMSIDPKVLTASCTRRSPSDQSETSPVTGGGPAACRRDLRGHLVCAVAHVVDDDCRTGGRECEGLGPAETCAGAGDCGYFAFQAQ